MSADNKILPLTVIAQKKNLPSARDALTILIQYEIIHAYLEEVTHINGEKIHDCGITSSSMDLLIPATYLNIILIKGAWEGTRIQVPSFDVDDKISRLIWLTLAPNTRISIEDLFVYENDFADLESRNPDIFVNWINPEKVIEPQSASADQPIAKLTNPAEIIRQISEKMSAITLTHKESQYIKALLARLDGKTFKECYLEANPKTQSSEPKTLLDQGKRYCKEAPRIVKEKMKIDFDISIIKGHMD